jgi:superfamily II DNA or RNA helicase
MIEAMTHPTDLFVTPHGLLRVEPGSSPSPWVDSEAAERVAGAFEGGPAAGLVHVGTRELNTVLPPAAAWWREFVRRYLTQLCHTPGLESAREIDALPRPPAEELTERVDSAPPMRGGEYLSVELLERHWLELDAKVRESIHRHPQGAGAWLRESHPLWRMVGRVTFHLAENRKHPTHPFAFMATYASRISSQSRLQHLPLGRALQEYAGARNKPVLVNLLVPIQKAAEQSQWIRDLVDSGRIFKALPWTPGEAYRLLKDAAVCEAAGVLVRLPDWWKGGRPPRPRVSVRIGQNRAAGLGANALLDFSAEMTLEGEPLTESEWADLLQAADGLALVRGKWVEVDPARMQEALAHWKQVEKLAGRDGLTFFEGMRLMAGFQAEIGSVGTDVGSAPEREWAGVQAGPWLEQVLAELRDPASMATAGPIPGLQAQLRPYQTVGINWLWFLWRLGLGGCLADDMGLGKTLQVLAVLLRRKAEPGPGRAPSLLVVPASLLANWRSEIQRFTPALSFVIVHPSESDHRVALEQSLQPRTASACQDEPLSSADQRIQIRDQESGIANLKSSPDLVITTYGMLTRLEALRHGSWDLVILDEAQAIKNAGTRQAKAVKELQAAGRFALTGTPVENRAADLWSLFDFLNPGLLGSAAAFTRFIRACDTAERPDYGPLRALTRPYILRRLKTDKRIIADLPDKTEVTAWCALTKQQAALYQKAVAELAEGLEGAEGIQRRGLVLAFIMRFKQICNHPAQWLNDGDYAPGASGKFGRLRELGEEIAERQEKLLLFTQFSEITDPLASYLGEVFQRPGLVLHGGTPVGRRRQLVESFQQDAGPPFFILTVKAGGTGLNLTQAAHVIHFDRWWNPAVENQATDRAFRIGQKQNVLVHKFVCRGTIEERIDRVIAEKQSLSTELLEGGGEKLLTEMDNRELLRFVALDLQRATEA